MHLRSESNGRMCSSVYLRVIQRAMRDDRPTDDGREDTPECCARRMPTTGCTPVCGALSLGGSSNTRSTALSSSSTPQNT